MLRALFRAFVVPLLAGSLAIALWDALTYDAAAWQADYQRLKQDMAGHYANLDWIVEHRGLELRRLDDETRAAIDGAYFRARAVLALQRFVAAFGDPHLRIQASEPQRAGSAEDTAPPAAVSCEAAGYVTRDYGFQFPFARAAGWTALGGDDFPRGMLGDTGVLRIAQFGEDMYLAACHEVFRPGLDRRALKLAVRASQQRKLVAALRELRERGAVRLLVDLSGNGGGSEWVTEVIALLTDRKMRRAGVRMAAPSCDRTGIWRGEAVCPVLAPAEEYAELQGTGEWTGPVVILVDRRTASASEDFVAWLQQNRVAKVIGEHTRGSGCGYVDGGVRTRLEASALEVKIPNCARFLDDGTNEIEGISPDVAIPMDGAPPQEQAAALVAVLAAL